jgi:hypothetical protein
MCYSVKRSNQFYSIARGGSYVAVLGKVYKLLHNQEVNNTETVQIEFLLRNSSLATPGFLKSFRVVRKAIYLNVQHQIDWGEEF